MLELCAKSGDRGEHGHLETSIHSSTVHWHILCCNRNRGLHVARPAPSFQTGGMANPTWSRYWREAHSSKSLHRLDFPCSGGRDTLAVDSYSLQQVNFGLICLALNIQTVAKSRLHSLTCPEGF